MKSILLATVLVAHPVLMRGADNKLEAAVKAGPRIHAVNFSAAKPGEHPHDYGGPGRGHKKPKPPKPLPKNK